MIEEQYISHKTAKLAWEKGFDEPCEYFLSYECDRFIRCSCTNGKIPITGYGNFCYWWNNIGDMDIRQFILSLDSGYFCQKMQNRISDISSTQKTERIALRNTMYILPALKEAIKKEIELENK